MSYKFLSTGSHDRKHSLTKPQKNKVIEKPVVQKRSSKEKKI